MSYTEKTKTKGATTGYDAGKSTPIRPSKLNPNPTPSPSPEPSPDKRLSNQGQKAQFKKLEDEENQ